ncbi:MAG: hypothetical protein KAG66_08750, partial [Methylococcales bacterium]|nr:hypothetical protein [Methylococcales bacterium]
MKEGTQLLNAVALAELGKFKNILYTGPSSSDDAKRILPGWTQLTMNIEWDIKDFLEAYRIYDKHMRVDMDAAKDTYRGEVDTKIDSATTKLIFYKKLLTVWLFVGIVCGYTPKRNPTNFYDMHNVVTALLDTGETESMMNDVHKYYEHFHDGKPGAVSGGIDYRMGITERIARMKALDLYNMSTVLLLWKEMGYPASMMAMAWTEPLMIPRGDRDALPRYEDVDDDTSIASMDSLSDVSVSVGEEGALDDNTEYIYVEEEEEEESSPDYSLLDMSSRKKAPVEEQIDNISSVSSASMSAETVSADDFVEALSSDETSADTSSGTSWGTSSGTSSGTDMDIVVEHDIVALPTIMGNKPVKVTNIDLISLCYSVSMCISHMGSDTKECVIGISRVKLLDMIAYARRIGEIYETNSDASRSSAARLFMSLMYVVTTLGSTYVRNYDIENVTSREFIDQHPEHHAIVYEDVISITNIARLTSVDVNRFASYDQLLAVMAKGISGLTTDDGIKRRITTFFTVKLLEISTTDAIKWPHIMCKYTTSLIERMIVLVYTYLMESIHGVVQHAGSHESAIDG